MSGPLEGLKVVELASIGPGPFAAMMLADMGAEVIRIERAGAVEPAGHGGDLLHRSRRSVGVDLKHPAGVAVVLRLAGVADAAMEGFRPGVAERLGVGPEACLAANPRLVYGRMTGWGQDGPQASRPGHDINYIALAGALDPIGTAGGPPVPPLNLVGDFGGGGMLLAFGMLCALLHAGRSGQGQVVDAAMVDGAALLMTMVHGLAATGLWSGPRGTNMLDGGAPFYATYQTAGGGYVAVGAIEPRFYAALLALVGLGAEEAAHQWDRSRWPTDKDRLAQRFLTRTRDQWCALAGAGDACLSPVLSMHEAPDHPHNRARATFVEHAGVVQPAPAPRFSATPGAISRAPAQPGQPPDETLSDWGFSAGEVAELREAGAVA